jgi:predicted proteasome-type protease
VDNGRTCRRVHLFQPAPDRFFVLDSAGNPAITQEVLDRVNQDLTDPGATESRATVGHLFEAALSMGRLGRAVAAIHRGAWLRWVPMVRSPFSSGVRSAAGRPTLCSSSPKGTTSGPPTTARSSRWARAGRASSPWGWAWPLTSMWPPQPSWPHFVGQHRRSQSVGGPPFELVNYSADSFQPLEARINTGSPFLARLEAV